MRAWLVDTGPLVAFLNRRDTFHGWAVETFERVAPPLHTCEPVLAEACHLLRHDPRGPQALLELMRRGALVLSFRLDEHVDRIRRLMDRYADVPMSLADGCLVRMSEIADEPSVITLDRDFRVYRRHGRRRIPLLMPEVR